MTWIATVENGFPEAYPLNDLREHKCGDPACWCLPFWEDGVLVHNSMDKREEYERGRLAS